MGNTGYQEIETTENYEFRYKILSERECSCKEKHILKLPYEESLDSADVIRYNCIRRNKDIYITNAGENWFTRLQKHEEVFVAMAEKIKITPLIN